MFGILQAGENETWFYPGLAGRNLGAGLAVLTFAFRKDRTATGTLLLCLMCNGFADTYICLTSPPPVINTWIHVMNTGILAVVGSGLLGLW